MNSFDDLEKIKADIEKYKDEVGHYNGSVHPMKIIARLNSILGGRC